MKRTLVTGTLLSLFVVATAASAQAPQRLVRFGGTVRDASGGAIAGVVTMRIDIFGVEDGGTPLWSESQTVTLDALGRYAVILGATETDGLPLDLLATGAPRWLGVHVDGLPDVPRVMLVGVPYAVKASDADTIGGKPLSAFVLAGDKSGVGADGLTYVDTRVLSAGLTSGANGPAPGPPSPLGGFGGAGGAGTANYVGLFSDATTLVNSVIYQTPAGSIGVNTTSPSAGFHAVSTAAPVAYYDVYSSSLGALPVVYRASRGTPSTPSAVQTDDILGGLAVRGYGSTAFSTGRGQVMFKAAENWTDSAQGTYLQVTTTPLGGATWLERMRVTPDGKVGIGTAAPSQLLTVAGTIESTSGGIKFPDGTTQTTALTLAANTFTATQTIASGNLALPGTTASTSGVVTTGGQPFLHGYGSATNTNTFVGRSAGNFTTSGTALTGLGYQALMANTFGDSNVAAGSRALTANTSGTGNTAVGAGAMLATTGGWYNTAVGYSALPANTTAYYNTAIGREVLKISTTGQHNTGVGNGALNEVTTGSNNTALGSTAGTNILTGSYNTFLGYGTHADASTPALTNATAIGAMANVGQDDSIVLGGASGTAYAVKVGIGTISPDTTLQVVGDIKVGTSGTNGCLKNYAGTGIAGTCSSDARLKTNVQPFGRVLGRVARLQPVRYAWKVDAFPEYHFGEGVSSGLIAQDVEQVFPEMVSTDERGYKMVNYSELPYLTLQAVKELKAENDALKARSERLETENDALKAQVAAIAERLARLEKKDEHR
jgi:hypothetical protein